MNGDFLQIALRGYNMMTRGPVLIKTGTSFIEESLHARMANSSYPVAEEIIVPLLKRNTTFGFSLAFYIFFHKIRCFLYKNNTKISSGKEIRKDPEKYNHVPRGKKY